MIQVRFSSVMQQRSFDEVSLAYVLDIGGVKME
jgi:hypothetical protein